MKLDLTAFKQFRKEFTNTLGKEFIVEAAEVFRGLLVDNVKRKLRVSGSGLSSIKNWEIDHYRKFRVALTPNFRIKPYAGIQHYGGQIEVTDNMRKKMWALFYSTGDPMYKAIALTKNKYIRIPASKYGDIDYGLYA